MNFDSFSIECVGGICIRCKAMPGTHVASAVREGIILAMVNNCEVDLEHNGRVYTLNPSNYIAMALHQEVKS